MATGVVKFFNEAKGFGFIAQGNGGVEIFVHRSALVGGQRLAEGQMVSFDIVKDKRGVLSAANVQITG